MSFIYMIIRGCRRAFKNASGNRHQYQQLKNMVGRVKKADTLKIRITQDQYQVLYYCALYDITGEHFKNRTAGKKMEQAAKFEDKVTEFVKLNAVK